MKRLVALLSLITLFSLGVSAQTLPSGEWTKKSFGVSGSWGVVQEDGQRFLVLDDRFKTKNAPDLKLFLSKQSLESTTGKNATSNAVLIAKLKSAKGAQRYAIPDSVDLGSFDTLLLHCEKYSKLWAGASLR